MIWRIDDGEDAPEAARKALTRFCERLRLQSPALSVAFTWLDDGWDILQSVNVDGDRLKTLMRSHGLPLAVEPEASRRRPAVGPGSGVRPERISPKNLALVTVEGAGETLLRGMVRNLSGGGFGAHLHGPRLEQGQVVLARITPFAHREAVRAPARVAWLRPHPDTDASLYGFTWLEAADLRAIRSLLASVVSAGGVAARPTPTREG